jgi:Bacteriophage lambda head decoration protein D
MAIIAQDQARLSNLVKAEQFPELGFCRTIGTFNGLAGSYKIGTVLGVVTATGKYIQAVQTAVDGSAVAAGVLMQDITIAASTDTAVLVMTRGPAAISKGGIVFDSTYDNSTKKNVVYAAFEAKGISVLEAA